MTREPPGIERTLAVLLSRGTALASMLIALGLMLSCGIEASLAPARLISAGVAIIIALPTVRVALMGFSFLRSGDRDLAGVTVLVLAIIALASIIGATAG